MDCRKSCWLILGFVLICLCANRGKAISNLADNQTSESDLVTQLPGQPQVGFNHYAGHVTVDEKGGRALFYWFYEAFSEKEQKPLLLWLNGGPGCSSVGYGATQEIGPFIVDPSGSTLSFNEYAWNNVSNILFVESPVGVGFSYTNQSSIYDILGDNLTAFDTFSFLQNWFTRFPEYKQHDFYIGGESYGGHYVPQLAEVIYDFNNRTTQTDRINLKGFLVGNPETHNGYDWKGNMDYAWSHGLISDETYNIIVNNCNFFVNNTFDNDKCNEAVNETLTQSDQVDRYSLYTPKCLVDSSTSTKANTKNLLKRRRLSTGSQSSYDPCEDNYSVKYYNRKDVQNALHATRGGEFVQWTPCNDSLFGNWKDAPDSILPIYQKLIAGGLRIWVYSGDTDARVSLISTRYAIDQLNLTINNPWGPWFHEQQVAGWTQDYVGLKYSTFYGVGHDVPNFYRDRALVFFTAFLSGAPLPDKR